MSNSNKRPTHEIKLVVDSFEVVENGETVKKDITQPVGVVWFNEDGSFGGGKITRNTIAMKGDSFKIFTIKDKNNSES